MQKKELYCGIIDHTMKLPDHTNKINFGSGVGDSDYLTVISNRKDRGARNVDIETHRKEQLGAQRLVAFSVWNEWRNSSLAGSLAKKIGQLVASLLL